MSLTATRLVRATMNYYYELLLLLLWTFLKLKTTFFHACELFFNISRPIASDSQNNVFVTPEEYQQEAYRSFGITQLMLTAVVSLNLGSKTTLLGAAKKST